MAQISDYLENALLDAVLFNTTYTSPTTVYVALHTADPTDAGGGAEVAGGSYARQSIAFSSAAFSSARNTSLITFPTATAAWGTVTHFGIWDASSGGNLLFHGPAHRVADVQINDVYQIPAGIIQCSLLTTLRGFNPSYDQRRPPLVRPENPAPIGGALADLLIDAVLNNLAYASPAAVYAGLFTSTVYPYDDPANLAEVVGGSYARTAITYAAAAAGVSASSALSFPTATANWGTVRFYGIFDALSGGNILFFDGFATPGGLVVNSGQTVSFAANDLNVSLL